VFNRFILIKYIFKTMSQQYITQKILEVKGKFDTVYQKLLLRGSNFSYEHEEDRDLWELKTILGQNLRKLEDELALKKLEEFRRKKELKDRIYVDKMSLQDVEKRIEKVRTELEKVDCELDKIKQYPLNTLRYDELIALRDSDLQKLIKWSEIKIIKTEENSLEQKYPKLMK